MRATAERGCGVDIGLKCYQPGRRMVPGDVAIIVNERLMKQAVAGSNFRADALHPDGQYSRFSKWFHWLTVPPLVVLLLSGLTIRFISDESKMRFYTLHESLGLLMLMLAATRLT